MGMFIKYVTVTQKSYKEGTKIKLTHCVKFHYLIKKLSPEAFWGAKGVTQWQ